jgi:hypothetical protein
MCRADSGKNRTFIILPGHEDVGLVQGQFEGANIKVLKNNIYFSGESGGSGINLCVTRN